MQSNLTIDVALIRKARQLTGVSSDTELLELGLRTLIQSQSPAREDRSRPKIHRDRVPTNPPVYPPANPIAALLESDFIGCAGTEATHFSRDYKTDLTATLETKHGHR
ncbi:type II toxin-antitoxin system VapB family antitoxin [uncultured Thiodictyon sp.]|uniref:type II toxin-antitoxin system VapB family antitoxin n=1 Tax=uncultured Thiodictyon sp. TaxID=1846217 RepID=UPI0025FC0588|nr:type II toxin-antitoxin system VapB family antitoxin [uncultured Thiodictyon sp.]